jgi:hypothetical protein
MLLRTHFHYENVPKVSARYMDVDIAHPSGNMHVFGKIVQSP